ncbi:hypothetical protein GZH53_15685 [Flavihumibacter sp. R14]|nr:hypothetical protein [Flavihumibacter soli]
MIHHLFTLTALLFNTTNISFVPALIESNYVESKNIRVTNAKNSFYTLGSAEELQKAFGKAAIEKVGDEVQGGYGYYYKYEGLEVYFHERRFNSITLSNAKFKVLLNGKAYKTGENISKLNKDFPVSFKKREWSYGQGMIRLDITHQKVFTDALIIFSYDTKGLITEIWIGSNNS